MNNKVKRKANKETKGITLIALVITIIVMLILAGVAISMTINSNGLFSKANTAGESWNTAVENERSELQDLLDDLEVEAPTIISTRLPAEKGWDSNKVSAVATQGKRKVPIPTGYTVSGIEGENTISGGLVIYATKDVDTTVDGFWTNTTEIDGKEYLTCQTTCDQYVWIPVDDINYMVMCKKNGSATKADGVTATEDGVTTCNLVLQNDGTLKCETHDSIDLCGRIYATRATTTDTSTPRIYTTTMTFNEATRATQTWAESSYHEPNLVSDYDKDSNASYLEAAGVSTASQLEAQLTNDFTVMATSVAKYGGFYVSRYEVGKNNEGNIVSQKNKKVLVAGNDTCKGSISGTYTASNMWYGLYNTLRNDIEVDTNVVNTHMIWGSQYDQIINFLGTNLNNGPQTGHTSRQLDEQKPTGSNKDDVMNNIYDLEGNNREWTVQAYSTYYRTGRGGLFANVAYLSTFHPASSCYDGDYPYVTYCYYASRCVLYIR